MQSLDMPQLLNKTAVISGASGGIGQKIALRLASNGWGLVLNSRSEFIPGDLVDYVNQGKVFHVRGDISDPSVCKAIVDTAVHEFGGLNCAILNAGIGFFGSFLDTPIDLISKIVETNLLGSIYFAQSAIPELVRHPSSHLIFISSTAGFRGGANEAVYASTKHAQNGLAGSLDREFRQAGLKVTVIAPGATETLFALNNGRDAATIQKQGYLDPSDVADAVSYALSAKQNSRIQQVVILPMSQQS
jgi:NADP-dependent 3-hydroxy acid dehydrogenase YdfG